MRGDDYPAKAKADELEECYQRGERQEKELIELRAANQELRKKVNVKDLSLERARRCDDNTKVSVKDLIAMVADDIERGELKDATRAIVIIIREPEDKNEIVTTDSYRCGMSSAEQVGYLELEKSDAIKRWKAQ